MILSCTKWHKFTLLTFPVKNQPIKNTYQSFITQSPNIGFNLVVNLFSFNYKLLYLFFETDDIVA